MNVSCDTQVTHFNDRFSLYQKERATPQEKLPVSSDIHVFLVRAAPPMMENTDKECKMLSVEETLHGRAARSRLNRGADGAVFSPGQLAVLGGSLHLSHPRWTFICTWS